MHFTYTGRTVQLTGWITSINNITAELNEDICFGESLQIWLKKHWGTLILDFKSCSDWMSANCFCQTPQKLLPRLRINVRLKSLMASSSCMIVPAPMWPTHYTSNWRPWSGKFSRMVHTAQPYCHTIFMLGTTKEVPKDVPSHQMSVQEAVGQWPRNSLQTAHANLCTNGAYV